MATFHGKDGTATWNGNIINIIDWTVNIDAEVAEVDYMAIAGDAKIKHVGHYRWSATINTYLDDTTAWTASPITSATDTAAKELVLTAITGVSYSGDAWCTAANPAGAVNGSPTVSFNFVGTSDGLTLAPA